MENGVYINPCFHCKVLRVNDSHHEFNYQLQLSYAIYNQHLHTPPPQTHAQPLILYSIHY
jgi:hypothetical protein